MLLPTWRSARTSASAIVVWHDLQIDSKRNDGLRNLRSDAADDAIRAHKLCRTNSFDEVLRDQSINRRHTAVARAVEHSWPLGQIPLPPTERAGGASDEGPDQHRKEKEE